MATTKDLYDILGISRGASQDDIKRAYRKQAIANHPDKNKDDKDAEERFKDVNEAYSILSDTQKKQLYDQYGYEALRQGMGSGGGGQSGGFSDMNFSSFNDLFEGAFGGESVFDSFFGEQTKSSGSRRSKGSDIHYELEISLKEAFSGTSYDFNVSKKMACEGCEGTGAQKGKEPTTCRDCGGAGQIRQNKGIFSINTTCPSCRGNGVIIENPCHSCGGGGVVNTRKQVKVKIPPGIDNGQSIRMGEEGSVSRRGGTPGDLYLSIRTRSDDYFERKDDDLYCSAQVSVSQLALGSKLELTNLNDETIKVAVPAGMQAGTVLRVKGEGMPKLQRRGERGDLMIRLNIQIPKNLPSQAKALYKQLSEIHKDSEKMSLAKLHEKKTFWKFR